MSGERTVEATGETVGEAKWRALRELELLVPSLDKAAVRFQVLSEGERGLLGVGYTPARVHGDRRRGRGRSPRGRPTRTRARPRAALRGARDAGGGRDRRALPGRGSTSRTTAIEVTCSGDDLGLLIGRHGQTIDAVQVLASAIVGRGDGDRKEVVVDAAGYRDRRRRTLESLALRSAEEAVRTGLARRARADERRRAEDRPHLARAQRRRHDLERRRGAEPLRGRRAGRLARRCRRSRTGSAPSSRPPG